MRPTQWWARWYLFGASWLMREGTRRQTGEWEGSYGEVDRQVDGGI